MSSIERPTPEISNSQQLFIDQSVEALYRQSIESGEAREYGGPLFIDTRPDTGRSPKDAYVVANSAAEHINFGEVSQEMDPEIFEKLSEKATSYLANQPRVFRQNLELSADSAYRLPVEVNTESAPGALFVRNLFRVPDSTNGPHLKSQTESGIDRYRMIHTPRLSTSPTDDGTRSDRAVAIDFEKKEVLVTGTKYLGEMKKVMFKVLQYELPKVNVLSMHCSANENTANGDLALFFGLSGTGKTTLSTDRNRRLIGDDEHGWSPQGVFNIEGGSYAKVIKLSEKSEPDIYHAVHRRGTILENVTADRDGNPLFERGIENMRAAYPLSFIEGSSETGKGQHPNNVFLLTASDVMPPIAKLSNEQAAYHFLSGYTSKMPGTEIGVDVPKPEFSAGYGHPFLMYHPTVYGEMFYALLQKHHPNVWIINTGWPFGFDNGRISIDQTRSLVSGALSGELENQSFHTDDLGFLIPDTVQGVPTEILYSKSMWSSEEHYLQQARELSAGFSSNFDKKGFSGVVPSEIASAGPHLQ